MVRPVGELLPFEEGFSAPANWDSDPYAGTDSDTSQNLQDASLALKIFSALLDFARMIGDKVQQAKLEKSIAQAKKKIADGQKEMADASMKINEASDGIYSANDQINSFVQNISSVKFEINTQLSLINDFSSSIFGINNQLVSANANLANAQSRLDYALNRANYSAGITGLQKQRADIRSANTDIFNIGSSINDLENTRENYITSMNTAGEKYNSLIPIAEAQARGAQSAYDLAKNYEAQRAQGAEQFNRGGQSVRDGIQTANDAGSDFKSWQQNFDLPIVEASSGAKNLSGALESFSEGNNFTGSAQVFNGGLESAIRNGGDATLKQYGGSLGMLLSSIGAGADQTLRSGGDFGDFALNATIQAGNSFVGLQNIIQAQQGLELASAIIDNTSNPTAPYQAGTVLAQQTVPNTIQALGTATTNVLPFTPFAPATPVVKAVLPGIVVGGTGIATTINEAINTPISTPITPDRTPLQIGRGLYAPTPGGPGVPSLGTVGAVGTVMTAVATAEAILTQFFESNPNLAIQTSQAIIGMSQSGNWTPPLRSGEITLRPPGAIPVTPIEVISGSAISQEQ
jgi:hypothetical protein